jgi:glycerol-3-phosphate acyltransferase PlsY
LIIAKFYLIILVGYLLGTIPSGLIVSRWKAKLDIRDYGSGKTGATNVLRKLGHKPALVVIGLDILKGALAVAFAGVIIGADFLIIGEFGIGLLLAQVVGALAAIAGHIWPIFFGFRGGRGVATFFGGLIALSPVAAVFGGEILIIGAGLSGFVSLGSIAGAVGAYAILVPLTLWNAFPVEYLIYAMAGSLLIIYMHRENIRRLLKGKERRLGEKA